MGAAAVRGVYSLGQRSGPACFNAVGRLVESAISLSCSVADAWIEVGGCVWPGPESLVGRWQRWQHAAFRLLAVIGIPSWLFSCRIEGAAVRVGHLGKGALSVYGQRRACVQCCFSVLGLLPGAWQGEVDLSQVRFATGYLCRSRLVLLGRVL